MKIEDISSDFNDVPTLTAAQEPLPSCPHQYNEIWIYILSGKLPVFVDGKLLCRIGRVNGLAHDLQPLVSH